MDDLSRFCCQNSRCDDYGKRGEENLTVSDHSRRCRTLRCRTCKARFSERKGTVFYGSRLPQEKVASILEHVNEGVGVRKAGRLLRVKRDTIIRYARLAGDHAKALHDELVAVSPCDPRSPDGSEVGLRLQEVETL